MNQDRFAGLFPPYRSEGGNHADDRTLRGFTTNPLVDRVNPLQAQMYQAAYEQARKDLQEPEWPDAECWN